MTQRCLVKMNCIPIFFKKKFFIEKLKNKERPSVISRYRFAEVARSSGKWHFISISFLSLSIVFGYSDIVLWEGRTGSQHGHHSWLYLEGACYKQRLLMWWESPGEAGILTGQQPYAHLARPCWRAKCILCEHSLACQGPGQRNKGQGFTGWLEGVLWPFISPFQNRLNVVKPMWNQK